MTSPRVPEEETSQIVARLAEEAPDYLGRIGRVARRALVAGGRAASESWATDTSENQAILDKLIRSAQAATGEGMAAAREQDAREQFVRRLESAARHIFSAEDCITLNPSMEVRTCAAVDRAAAEIAASLGVTDKAFVAARSKTIWALALQEWSGASAQRVNRLAQHVRQLGRQAAATAFAVETETRLTERVRERTWRPVWETTHAALAALGIADRPETHGLAEESWLEVATEWQRKSRR